MCSGVLGGSWCMCSGSVGCELVYVQWECWVGVGVCVAVVLGESWCMCSGSVGWELVYVQ